MTPTRTSRSSDTASKPALWLRVGAFTLIAAMLLGPGTGLAGALHERLAHAHHHDHDCEPKAPSHEDCAICHYVHAPLATSLIGVTIPAPTYLGTADDDLYRAPCQPRLDYPSARGPPSA